MIVIKMKISEKEILEMRKNSKNNKLETILTSNYPNAEIFKHLRLE
jgi:hypothetical protein